MAHAADSYVGRFNTLLFSNTAYIGVADCGGTGLRAWGEIGKGRDGLMILWLFNPYDVKWLLVISVVLLSLGTSGDYILQAVLLDLVDNNHDTDKLQHDDETKERSHARAETWSRIVYIAAAISAILWVTPDAVGGFHPSWTSSFLICVIAITTTLIIFCWGHNIYHQGRLTERPAQVVFRFLGERIKKLLKCLR
ncbi:hypothetical protein L1987_50334 [Smallanthus sonchifolius]|nr:hypothetical protein L1987_50334 [Smallanthus sonchifolius]